ncbi:membrane-targeted effector domain-containing toxin [Pseudomonas putida]|uniref:membrane-targeted effector domain-containing toxin n=1 Tax=Pseudomonas putida TaxID=303 RepID=UPI0005BDFF58|nr:membrane-targeted effector domain-containing toxin [Pseudomonas putida]
MDLSTQQQKTLQQLQQLAMPLVTACPDMRQIARDTALAILAKHQHPALDPDQVYLNRFATAVSSPRTFSGWQHFDPPVQSLTLPQLVMHRFDVHDQDNADLLSYLTGFYKDGAGKDVYDEHNEIPIAPQSILQDFWQIDFSSTFHQRLHDFWQQHADGYRTLAKVNFLAKVLEVRSDSPRSELARRAHRVAAALAGTSTWPPSLEQLQQHASPAAGYRVCTFDIGGHLATDILRVEMDDGYQLLYTPGESEALHLFANRSELYQWVLMNTNQADNRARFMGHFALESHAEKASSVGLNHMIDLLFFNWGGDDHHCLNQLDHTLTGDAFSHLRDAARQRMNDDAHFALRSNADLRKQLWIGYLTAFGEIAGAMAAVDWPIALAAVGAGLAETGLNIDQAITGHTTAERQQGVTGAVLAAINTLFNATLLTGVAGKPLDEFAELDEAEGAETGHEPEPEDDLLPATPGEIEAWVPEPHRPLGQLALLAPFETNAVLASKPGSGTLEGIYTQEGNFYALIDEQPYQVRFVAEMNTWVVVDPEHPFSFYRNVPIRLGADGQWQPFERPGLRGGMLPRKLLARWGRVSGAAVAELPDSPYNIPQAMRSGLKAAAQGGNDRVLSGIFADLDPVANERYAEFRRRRNALATDASQFLETVQLPPRPELPELPRESGPKQIIRSLYERSHGLVVGEGHSQLGSKRFLIDNMALLKKQKVSVLYMEHFLTDFQQADLDVFNRTGQMPKDLQTYVETLDEGHWTDRSGRYTFKQVLIAAQKQGIRIQPIDCMASYRQAWEGTPLPQIRQKMMNYFAHLTIDADQATRGPGKWIALVGSTHSNTYEGVPGLSELQGAVGLRFEDIEFGKVGGIEVDPGRTVVSDDFSLQRVQGDLRMQVAVAQHAKGSGNLEAALVNKGMFAFSDLDGQLTLVHRSHDGQLKYTPVRQDGRYVHIEKPDWPWISGRRLDGLAQLRDALARRGLRYVRP